MHFRSYAVSGMMSLCNAEGRGRESNDDNTIVGLDIYQYRESIMATQLTDIVESSQAERVATGFVFTEGPVWHPEGYWLFVDVRASLIYRLVPGGQLEIFREQSGGSNGMTFDLRGRLLICEGDNRQVTRREPDGTYTPLAQRLGGSASTGPMTL